MSWERGHPMKEGSHRPSVTFQGINSDVGTVVPVGGGGVDHQLHSRELAVMWERSSQAKKQTISYIPGN